MLVFSRLRDEWIDIETPEGRLISVQIVAIRGIKVRVGIEADKEVSIDRREVREAKREEACRREQRIIDDEVSRLLTPDAAIIEAAKDCCS